ncbi:MAG TPA: metal-dependent hydrolase [Thermoleophilia bacterium]|nr:metal-dependent hydrolase [Thermoleophilia bacterium]
MELKAGGHVVAGAVVACFALWGLQRSGAEIPADVLVAGVLVGSVGALVPDIDHPGSTVSRRVPRRLLHEALRVTVPLIAIAAVSVALGYTGVAGEALAAGRPVIGLGLLLLLMAAAIVAVSLLVSRIFGHRGATHSLVFALGAGLLVAALCGRIGMSPWYGVPFGLGWLSHLAVDAGGHRGVPSLLWPLAGRR